MEEVKKEAAEFMKVRAVWQFFRGGGGGRFSAAFWAGRE